MGDPQSPKDRVTVPPRTRWHRIRRFVLRRLIIYPLIYLGVILVFLALEKLLIFRPSSSAEWWHEPDESRTEDVWFFDSRATKLHGWWIPPRNPGAGVVLVAHGNGGNISHRGRLAAKLHRTLDGGVFLFDYPGYGKSEGSPDEAGCYASGDAAYKWLTEVAKVPPSRIVLLGESLGGGTAVELATRHEHRALVLAFTFTSLPAAAKFHYPWLPTQWLMRTRFDNLSKIKRCTRPVFIAHGTADEVIPFHHGETLFAAANEPKQFFRMEGATHNILLGDDFYAMLARFLAEKAP